VNADVLIDYDEVVRLGPVIEKGGIYYSDFEGIVIDGKPIAPGSMRRMAELEGWDRIFWYKIESREPKYMNTKKNPGWWAPVKYDEHLVAAGKRTKLEADVAPVKLGGVVWKGRNVGTMRFRVAVRFNDITLASPGIETSTAGGALPGVRRVSRKGGTGIPGVDQAMAMANLPYIWASAALDGTKGAASHQAEQFIGADCADFVVAAWRRAGAASFGYRAVIPLMKAFKDSAHALPIAYAKKGFYYSGPDKAVQVGPWGAEPGAAIAWRFGPGRGKGHMALLVEDRGPGGKANGVLDEQDRVLHMRWNTPALAAIRDALPGVVPSLVINPQAVFGEGE
jgi:cell wall-associated NlpC family hydrolase